MIRPGSLVKVVRGGGSYDGRYGGVVGRYPAANDIDHSVDVMFPRQRYGTLFYAHSVEEV